MRCLQDALLASREQLFALAELAATADAGPGGGGGSEAVHDVATLGAELKEALANTARLEKEVRVCSGACALIAGGTCRG